MDRILNFYSVGLEGDQVVTWIRGVIFALIIVAAFWFLSLLVRFLLTRWIPRITAMTSTDLDDRILVRISPPVELLTLFAGIYLAVRSLPLPEKLHVFVAGSIFCVNVAVFINIAYRMADECLSWYARRVEERTGSAIGAHIIPLIRKVTTIFLVGAGLIVALKHFGYDVLSLLTALGIGSLAIGLAAKDTLANMISGFTLMIDRPFRIGDRIQLASGKLGDVVDIGLRSTKIRTPENTLLIIPNAELCNSTVLNMAFPDMISQGRVAVGVGYGSDLAQVKRILVEVAQEDPDVLADPSPVSFFVSFGDNALQMSLIFWVTDYTKVFQVTDRLNTGIMSRFTRDGITIPYPTRKVVLEREGICPTE